MVNYFNAKREYNRKWGKKKDATQGREEGEPVPMKSEVSKDHKDPQLWAGRKDRYAGLLTP